MLKNYLILVTLHILITTNTSFPSTCLWNYILGIFKLYSTKFCTSFSEVVMRERPSTSKKITYNLFYCGGLEPNPQCLWGMPVNWCSYGKEYGGPQKKKKIKNRTTVWSSNSLLGIYSKKPKILTRKYTYACPCLLQCNL